MALRFVAGETLDQAVRAIAELNKKGIMATFDHLGENIASPDAAKAAADSYIEILERIASTGINSNVSLKLTQMGLDVDEELCFQNVSRICRRAVPFTAKAERSNPRGTTSNFDAGATSRATISLRTSSLTAMRTFVACANRRSICRKNSVIRDEKYPWSE